MIYPPGSTSVSIDVFFADDSGHALTGKVAADFPAVKWSGGSNVASTTITISDLAAITTAHPNDNTAGGVKEREGGWYRLDLPNNMFTTAGRKTLTFAETTDKRLVAPPLDVQVIQSDLRQIDGTANGTATLAVGAVTVAGTTILTGRLTLTGGCTSGNAALAGNALRLINNSASATVSLEQGATDGTVVDVVAAGTLGTAFNIQAGYGLSFLLTSASGYAIFASGGTGIHVEPANNLNAIELVASGTGKAIAATGPSTLNTVTMDLSGTVTTTTNLTNLPTIPADWITAAGIAADAVVEIQSGLATAAALAAAVVFIDTEIASILAAVDTEIGTIITNLAIVDGVADAILVHTTALMTYRLDQIFTADVAAPAAGSLVADLTEDNAGTRRLTTAALVNAPGGGTGLTAQQTRDAMMLAPTAGAPAAGSVDKHLDDILAAGGVAGAGADACTLRITENGLLAGTAVENAQVWITTDAAGTLVYAGPLLTDSSGDVTFLLDDGEDYYCWAQKGGQNSVQGELFTAEAD